MNVIEEEQTSFIFEPYCGAYVNPETREHKGLSNCFCGWSRHGGSGYANLIEDGETIEPEDY